MGTQNKTRHGTDLVDRGSDDRDDGQAFESPGIPAYLPTEAIAASMPLWSLPKSRKSASVKTITREVRTTSGTRQTIQLSVLSADQWGLPSVTDLEFFYAIEAWLLHNRDGEVPPVIHFAPQTLLRLMGKSGCGRNYQELHRFLLRMTGTTIMLTTHATAQSESTRRGRSRNAVFHVYDAVYLPGQPSREEDDGGPMYHVRIKLSDWYRNSLITGNCLLIDHRLFRTLRTPLGKLLSVLLHHLFALQEGVAMQRYNHLVEQWQLMAFSSPSRIRQQFAAAHEELLKQEFLANWDLRSMSNNNFMFLWEAGAAWWRMRRDHEGSFLNLNAVHTQIDPFLETALEAVENAKEISVVARNQETPSAEQYQDLWEAVSALSGDRKDPEVWARWWRRAITEIPAQMLWHRIGEVRELKQQGRIRNAGSYLLALVRADAKKCRLSWA